MEFHSSHIPHLLHKVLSGDTSLQEVNSLVRHAHHFAIIRLKQLLASGRLHLQSFPVTLESTAIDCIAELFERDSDGTFVELDHYFTVEHDLTQLTDDDIIAMFRGLVFTKLNDGLFSLYRENDPVLSKIIRNLKIAVTRSKDCSLHQSLGITMIVVECDEDRTVLPELTMERMEQHVSDELRGNCSSTEFIVSVKKLITVSGDVRNSVSLIDLAVCMKRHMLRYQIPLRDVMMGDESLFTADAASLIDETILQMKKQLAVRYVSTQKMGQPQFTGYIQAIEMMTKDTFLRSDVSEKKYGEYLQEQFPELTYEEYRRDHRKQFEYMAKLVKKAVRERLKELL